MGWGGGFGYRIPETGRTVAKAFYAGKACKRSNCETDGTHYWLEGSMIARRVPDDELTDEIAKAVQGLPHHRPLEFTFAGWPTQMTCRHLLALGLDCVIEREHEYGPRGGVGEKHDVALMLGVEVWSKGWYTPDELRNMPRWEQPVWVPPTHRVVDTRVVPRNLELAFA